MTTSSPASVRPRRRLVRLTAAGVTLGVAAAAIVGSTGANAAAKPRAQAVGRFVDGTVGGMSIEDLADVKDARAQAAPDSSSRNPLTATLLKQITVPIGDALKLPGGGVFSLGVANQLAEAKTTGYSYGASGAVSNTGGADLTDNQGAYPSTAKIDLSTAALGSTSIPALPALPTLPGVPSAPGLPAGSADALGGVSADVGAVATLAQTKAGGAFGKPAYSIAGLDLNLSSPALAALLKQLTAGGKQVTALLTPVVAALGATLPAACPLNITEVPDTLTLDKGAVVLDASSGAITVSVDKLLTQLGLDLNNLPPNTDLLAYVVNNLGDILSKGLANVVTGITDPLQAAGTTCLDALPTPLKATITTLLGTLKTGQDQLTTNLGNISDQLSSAGAPGLLALTDGLSQVAKIGVNVQQGAFPLSSAATPKYKFTSTLKATPNQATPVVQGQGVVRAIEIDIAGGQAASVALATSAAGPSSDVAPAATTTPSTVPNTAIPTGVPAGAAGHQGGGSPALPIVLVLVGLILAGGGVTAYRVRGRFSH